MTWHCRLAVAFLKNDLPSVLCVLLQRYPVPVRTTRTVIPKLPTLLSSVVPLSCRNVAGVT